LRRYPPAVAGTRMRRKKCRTPREDPPMINLAKRPLLTGVAFVLIALPAPTQRAAPARNAIPPLVVPDGLGVNIHFTDPRPGEMAMLAAGGFKLVRMDFAWGAIEKERGRYDFSAYDRLMAALAPHHIRAQFILDYSNRFYDNDQSPHTD